MAKKEKNQSSQRKAPLGGKRLAAVRALVENRVYPLNEAVQVIKNCAKAKFDETIEIAINLGVDVTDSAQQVRGVVPMPNGVGKTVRVAVFTNDPKKIKEAKDAGADVIGAQELVDEISKTGKINFDRAIATPDMMPIVSKAAKVLGPRGLMPNPKLGTVTQDIGAAVKTAKTGQVEFRTEKGGVVHAGVGKASFDNKALEENIKALAKAIQLAKPANIKGIYFKKATISSTLGPGIQVDIQSLLAA